MVALFLAGLASPCWAPFEPRLGEGPDNAPAKADRDYQERDEVAREAAKQRDLQKALLPPGAPAVQGETVPAGGGSARQAPAPASNPRPAGQSVPPARPPGALTPGAILLVLLAVGVIVAVLWSHRRRR
jgi:hypothetical protein